MPSVAEYDQLENPYRSTQYATVEPGTIGLDELRAFIGGNAAYYLRKWAPRLTSPDGECGMNWAAFFLTSLWMFYRKMYRNGLICIGAGMVMSLALNLMFLLVFRAPKVPLSATLIANLLFCLVCGAFGNAWYLSHTQSKITTARAQGLSGDRLLFNLQQRGGTSLLVVFLVVGLLLVFGFVLGILAAVAGAGRRVAVFACGSSN